ncbi:DUF3021 domain-containing protein [Liquorilactobacillus hordei]|uniref:DUF3021 domain-containing protein n=1 Tax=Liquorilactobacillus hordei TaxID=468911 RepID=UPI001CBEBB8D|nr:DUF3021 domain-containing protein [Liquorilactobacillus hordei]MBZ2405850.1 hypothetical protein [Liquorilactobacillus hordei]
MKKIILQILFGITVGIFIGFTTALTFSFIYQSKYFSPSAPHFITFFSSNIMATAISAILWSFMGILFSLSSMIFEKENWSITRQTITHLIVSYLGFTPLAILAGWFPLTVLWLISYTIIFLIIYLIIWSISMLTAKKEIEELNQLISNKK